MNIYRYCSYCIHTPGRRQSKTPILSSNVDRKSLETENWIVILRHIGDKLQLKRLFRSRFDPRSSIVDSVFDCRLHDVIQTFYSLHQEYQPAHIKRLTFSGMLEIL